MGERAIHITEQDMQRLKDLLWDAKRENPRGRDDLRQLEAELERATLVSAHEVPPDVITMNSRLRLVDLDTGEEMICTLVFPKDADIDESKISVLAPIGTGMLGFRVSDTFDWQVPAGRRRLMVKEVLYQPEASGDYEL